jgi:transcription termination factor Rho
MSGEQLERSILERKERDELRAIAEAMSLEMGPRERKSDLVDKILRAAGVAVDGGGGAAGETPPVPNGAGAGGTAASPPDVPEPRLFDGDGAAHGNGAPSAPRRSARAGGRKRPTEQAAPPAETSEAREDGVGAHGADEGGRGGSPLPAAGGASPETEAGERAARVAGTASPEGEASGGGSGESAPVVVATPPEVAPAPVLPRGLPGAARNGPALGAGPNLVAEPGNRRGRRRRGRDRERGEPQGAGQEAAWHGEVVPVRGLLDLREEGYGFLRTSGYLPSPRDVYVSVSQARRLGLRRGDVIEGACRPAGPGEKYPALVRVDSVCGLPPEEARERPRFEDLTPLFPDQRLRLERRDDPTNVTTRIIDLISPIGKGQRGMIVSPPKAGKTTIMKQIAHSIEQNDPEVHLMVLLVDERPEEVTDMRRSVRGEVVASTFDRPSDEHTAVAELAIERAKRLVELKRDVVIILDGITRLARAYNLAQPATGRIMSGGVDSGALYPPKKFFGAARNIEEGGSLTILATALVETGSKMDEVIFEEFKGTGNMELRLDRKLAERRIYPAIDVNASSTRHEELLFDRSQLQQVWKLRRVLNALSSEGNAAAGLELLMDKIRTTRSNDEFLAEIAKAPTPVA